MLELPSFKGRAGWEFTELGDFTLDAWEPAEVSGVCAAVRVRSTGRVQHKRP